MTAAPRPLAGAFAIGGAALFLLAGYEFARSPSVTLFLEHYGAHRLPFVLALSPVATFAVVYGYGLLLSRLGARRTLVVTSLLSGLALAAGFVGLEAGIAATTIPLFAFREAYIVLLIEQYWSFINSVLSRDQAKRVNGPICGVASIGGIAGGAAVGALAEPLGSHVLILFAAASTVPAAACGWLAYRLGGEPAASESRREAHGTLALDLFGRYGTLRLVGLMVVATQVVSTVLDLRFSGLLEAEIDVTDQRTAYLGTFWSTVNGVTFGLQFVAVPLLLRYLSLRVVHMGLPLLHLTAAAILILYPSLAVAAAAFLLFKTVDYSVFRAAKEILYMPLPFDARYRAKEVIDAVGYRAAKGGIATILAVGGAAVRELPGALYPGIGALASGFWLALVAGYLPREEASEP